MQKPLPALLRVPQTGQYTPSCAATAVVPVAGDAGDAEGVTEAGAPGEASAVPATSRKATRQTVEAGRCPEEGTRVSMFIGPGAF